MFSPKVVVATVGHSRERRSKVNSTQELREKLSHARGRNSRLPFGATVNLFFSNELFNPREIILVK